MDIAEFLNNVGYFQYSKDYSEIETSDDKEQLEKCTDDYIDHLCSLFVDYPIEKVYAVIDCLNTYNYDLIQKLLEKNNDIFMRAFIVMKTIYGINPLSIKNNLTEILNKQKDKIESSGLDELRKQRVFLHKSKEYKLLNNYLNSFNNQKIEEMVSQDIKKFYQGLHIIDKIVFFHDSHDNENNKAKIIDYLFCQSKLDMDIINKIYNEVLLKNEFLVSFDYDQIIMSNSKYIRNIKGLYRKCGENFFELFSVRKLDKEKIKELSDTLSDIVKLNSDDEIGLNYFFTRLNMHLSKKTKKYLEQFDYYKKYANADIKKLYDKTIDKLINKDLGINKSILESIGLYNGFLDKYDTFLDLFCKSDNPEYQELLSIPLAVGLTEKLRRDNNLDYRIVLSSSQIDNETFGSYNDQQNFLYVNPYIFQLFGDKKQAFAKAVDTIFHEVRHAQQFDKLKQDGTLNFNYFIMAMDKILSLVLPRYNKINYYNISYERDARVSSFQEARKFFARYTDMQEELDKLNDMRRYPKEIQDFYKNINEENIFKLLVRKDPKRNNQAVNEYGIYELFLKYCNECINKTDLRQLSYTIKTKCPMLMQFFDVDFKNKQLIPLKDHTITKMMKRVDRILDIKEKQEALYTMKMYGYMIKMQNYMNNTRDNNYQSIQNQTDDEIENNIGEIPTRFKR